MKHRLNHKTDRFKQWDGDSSGSFEDETGSLANRSLIKTRARLLIAKHRQHQKAYAVSFYGLELTLFPEVFCPAYGEGSRLLAECIKNLDLNSHKRVLEIGTGSGAIGLLAAKKGAKVLTTDISSAAVECAQENANRMKLNGCFSVVHGDIFANIMPTPSFSLVLFNPPFMEGDPSGLLEMAMYDPGHSTLRRFFKDLPRYLSRDGCALVAFSNCGDLNLFFFEAETNGFTVEEVLRESCGLIFYVFKLFYAKGRGPTQ